MSEDMEREVWGETSKHKLTVMPKGRFTPFTKSQERKILAEYLCKPTKKLAEELNCSFGRIRRFLENRDLVIPDATIEQWKRMSQFKKGDAPVNKGKKMEDFLSPETIAKFRSYQFKKGNIPHNAKKEGDGAISIRKDSKGHFYKYIRISKAKWELLHRQIWQQHHGEIPDGHVIIFKDKDSMNCCIDNLEMISMEEHMLRNSKHDYPEEIVPTLALINRLEKTINSKQNG